MIIELDVKYSICPVSYKKQMNKYPLPMNYFGYSFQHYMYRRFWTTKVQLIYFMSILS